MVPSVQTVLAVHIVQAFLAGYSDEAGFAVHVAQVVVAVLVVQAVQVVPSVQTVLAVHIVQAVLVGYSDEVGVAVHVIQMVVVVHVFEVVLEIH